MAVLCAAEIGAEQNSLAIPVEGVYTFGEPRVGNTAFRNFYNNGSKVSWRLTHWRDPVPHLPLKVRVLEFICVYVGMCCTSEHADHVFGPCVCVCLRVCYACVWSLCVRVQIMGFDHISTEVFYTENSTQYTICDGSGEDHLCSDKFAIDANILDHLTYLNQPCCC